MRRKVRAYLWDLWACFLIRNSVGRTFDSLSKYLGERGHWQEKNLIRFLSWRLKLSENPFNMFPSSPHFIWCRMKNSVGRTR